MYERTGALVQKKFREYLLPTVMTSLAMSLASVIDSVIVGNLLGDTALAAVGLSGPVIFCINMIYMLFGVGGVTCASVAKGRREGERANQLFTLTMAFGMGIMFLFLIAMFVFMGPLTMALAAGDTQLAGLTADYLRPLLFTGPALMFSSGMALFIRTDGSPKSSAVIVVIANVVNLVFDFVLIRFLNTGIAGAGLSTSLGYAAGAVIVIPYLISKNRSFRFMLPQKGELKVLKDILYTGLPKALTQATSLLRSIVLNGIVMVSLGSIGMSVMTVCINVLMISNIFVGGTSDALLPIVGTLFGERDYYGIRKTVNSAYRVLVIACAALMTFFLITPQTVGLWFGITSQDGLAVLVPALRLFAVYLPFSAFNTVLQNFYTTTGREKIASYIAMLDGFIFVSGFALLFSMISSTLLWLCYACSGAATAAFIFIMGAWIKRKEQVSGLLLLREENELGTIWDITINATAKEATGLSEQVIDFCLKNGVDALTANRIGVAVEEMAINTASVAHKNRTPGAIDILLHITEDRLIIRFRDDGAIFDPAAYCSKEEEDCVTDGIEVVKKLAASIDYARQLGFNTTLLTFDRN